MVKKQKIRQKRRDVKERAVQYKGGKCTNCGYNTCQAALTFHHLDPNEKDFGISEKASKMDWDIIKKELDKCILLCSNCHIELHNLK